MARHLQSLGENKARTIALFDMSWNGATAAFAQCFPCATPIRCARGRRLNKCAGGPAAIGRMPRRTAPAGLIIDVSGMPDLFDGEEHLRADLEARLERVDRNAQVGLGHASSLVSGCKGVAAGSTRPCGGKDPRGHPHEEDGAGIPGAGPRATLLRPTRLPGRWRRAGSGYRAVPRYSA